MTNNASPLGKFNCGELCNSICCTVENGERNDVLEEMLEVGDDGKSEMDKLIIKYMGLEEGEE